MKIDDWNVDIERGMEDCMPAEPWKTSRCVVCGKSVPPTARGIHPSGVVTYTVEFETRDEIPRDVNLRMFHPSLPDAPAIITEHTAQPGESNKCIATFVQRETVTVAVA